MQKSYPIAYFIVAIPITAAYIPFITSTVKGTLDHTGQHVTGESLGLIWGAVLQGPRPA